VFIQRTGVAMPFPVQKAVRPTALAYAYVVRREEGIRVTDLISSSYKVLAYFSKKNRGNGINCIAACNAVSRHRTESVRDLGSARWDDL